MTRRSHLVRTAALAALLMGFVATGAVTVRAQGPVTAPADDARAPANLRPLLQPRGSELALITTRYTLDRVTLAGNFLGGMRRQTGRDRGDAAPAPVASVSPNRFARLKRFDLDWESALATLDRDRLSAAGRADLDRLLATVRSNMAQLDADLTALAQISPLLPFAPPIVELVEARIRIEDVDAQKAAGVVADVARQVSRTSARLEAGLAGGGAPAALRAGKDLAIRAAAAVDELREALSEWFAFRNGYDPIFTWWVALPFKRADAALEGYATLLRDKVAPADSPSPNVPTAAAVTVTPAPVPKYGSVPDLQELVSLPHDEMTGIVQRFVGPVGRGDRGGTPPPAGAAAQAPPTRPGEQRPPQAGAGQTEAAPGPVRDRKFYEGWLAALKTLEFDRLSRNAQVDYLYIRKMCEMQIARSGVTLPPNPPRKTDESGITGAARGRQALIFDLQDELIPYTPEELIALAEKEFAWHEDEMKKASRALGLGDDWKLALEKMKAIHPPPGGQPAVVRDLMFEAVDYLRAHDLMTVPAVAAESLHMIMMTPDRQLVNPFFLGGSVITVSYPTDTMEYEARLQSMRGNNTPFSHATAFHEMIPGHNLVGYMSARFGAYRARLGRSTSFYGEGWPLYWELMMYELGFHDTPEKRVGALFWRMHRCARIIFSLKFHLGEWSPQECIDFLVDRVAFERDNATAEVRRSFQGDYGPLYQAAYLLGGLQVRALRRDLVESGSLTAKQFHDEFLRQGSMPIALLRLAMGRQKLTREMSVDWKSYGERPGS